MIIKSPWIPRTSSLAALLAYPLSAVAFFLPRELFDGVYLSMALIFIGSAFFNAVYLWRLITKVQRFEE